jgi:hypothetical protein
MPRTKYHLVDLPATASLKALVQRAHLQWAERQYQELKDELGLAHFEGRSLPGWPRHVVLSGLAHSLLQGGRPRRRHAALTRPQVRAVVQGIDGPSLSHEAPRPAGDARTERRQAPNMTGSH